MTWGINQTNSDEEELSGSAYDAIRGDETIQYTPIEPDPAEPSEPPSEPPGWLADFSEFLDTIFSPIAYFFGAAWGVVMWILIGGIVLCILYLIWKLLAPIIDLKPKADITDDTDWVPEESEAIALLDEADRLAATGDFDAATHLLLKRSIRQISDARPDLVQPSSTARELATLPALPAIARSTFSTIADRVERSLFALKHLGRDDWEVARAAYAQFALQHLSGGKE